MQESGHDKLRPLTPRPTQREGGYPTFVATCTVSVLKSRTPFFHPSLLSTQFSPFSPTVSFPPPLMHGTVEEPIRMEVAEVPQAPSINLAQKMSSAKQRTRRVKVKAAREEKIKRRMAASVVDVAYAARRARPQYRRHRGRSIICFRTTTPPSNSEPPPVRSYIVDVNAATLFSEYSLPQLVWERTAGGQ